jgi:hypothetical protein
MPSSSIRNKIRKEMMDKSNSSINLAGIQEEKEGNGQTTQPISEYEELHLPCDTRGRQVLWGQPKC